MITQLGAILAPHWLLGTLWETLGRLLEDFEEALERFGEASGGFGGLWGASGRLRGGFGEALGAFGEALGRLWETLGIFGEALGWHCAPDLRAGGWLPPPLLPLYIQKKQTPDQPPQRPHINIVI